MGKRRIFSVFVDAVKLVVQIQDEAAAGPRATTAVLTPPLSLDGGLAAEHRPPNLLRRVLSFFGSVRPGSDLTQFQASALCAISILIVALTSFDVHDATILEAIEDCMVQIVPELNNDGVSNQELDRSSDDRRCLE